MLQIDCPWCGTRNEREFICAGQSHIIRPHNPQLASDKQWADYLFYRNNPLGISLERWHHRFGCRQWFNVARDTSDHRIVAVYTMNEPAPDIANAETASARRTIGGV